MKSILLMSFLFSTLSIADGIPIPSKGQCPARYHYSSGFCLPNEKTTFALPRLEGSNCPGGFMYSNGYCIATQKNRIAVPSNMGQCPSSFRRSGEYCVK